MLGEPNRSGSPRVRPQACSSRMLRAGTEGCTTNMFGLTPARPTGASTSSGSKLIDVPSARATSTAAVENISEWPSGGACSTAGTPPPPPRLVTHDATMEASQGILVGQGRGCRVLRDELAGFIGQMDKYAGGRGGAADRAFWLQAFDGGGFAADRVGRDTVAVDNLLVALCGGIQPDRLSSFGNLTDDGLWQMA